jgi:flagellar biosynthetic protein FliR
VTLPEYLYPHVAPFLLLGARLGGLFVFSPLLSSAIIPPRIKALFVFMLTLALFPLAGPIAVPDPDIFTLGVAVGCEVLIGVTLGLIAALPLYAAQLGGQLIDHQIGLGLAAVYNPALDTDATVIADLILNIAIAIFLALGGLDALFVGVAHSLTAMPLGGAHVFDSPLDLMVTLISSGLELALRIAAPVLGVITLETVAAAVVSKTMPQINILSIGFAIKVVVGFMALIAALAPINGAVADAVNTGLDAMLQWASSTR